MNRTPVHPQTASPKPYALLGSGELTSSLWKLGSEQDGWKYRFNLFRIDQTTGRAGEWFTPQDIERLLRMLRVLAYELAEDGCLNAALRRRLFELAAQLDDVINADSSRSTTPQNHEP